MTRQNENPRDAWRTPRWLVRYCEDLAGATFDADAAADAENCVAPLLADGLRDPWGRRTFCNPPYSQVPLWVDKALAEHARFLTANTLHSFLLVLPGRTDQPWFAKLLGCAYLRLIFLQGRVRFLAPLTLLDAPAHSPREPTIIAQIGTKPTHPLCTAQVQKLQNTYAVV